jgi:hypothetical protein
MDPKSHMIYMKSVKQSVLDGTSKWSAKLTITGENLHWKQTNMYKQPY